MAREKGARARLAQPKARQDAFLAEPPARQTRTEEREAQRVESDEPVREERVVAGAGLTRGRGARRWLEAQWK